MNRGSLRQWSADLLRMSCGASLLLPGVRSFHRSFQGGGGPRIVLFYYHRTYDRDDQPVYQLGIHKDLFRKQLNDLRRSYRFVPLLTALEAARDGRTREDLASLTFDDGYRDNYTIAWPILKELGIPATIFLVAGLIGTKQRLWYDQLKVLLESVPGPAMTLPSALGGGELALDTPAARRRSMDEVLRRLKSCSDELRRQIVEELAGKYKYMEPGVDSRDLLLSWEEARAMEDGGIRFGSHTMSHPLLSRITDSTPLRAELAESREILARQLRHALPVLAYPGGDWSEETVRVARESGYIAALINRPGSLGHATDPMLVPRRGIGPKSSLFAGNRHSRSILLGESEGLWDGLRKRGRAEHAPPRAALPASPAPTRPPVPASSKEIVAASFDRMAEAYKQGRGEDPAFSGEEREILSMLQCPPNRAIEIGCGAGITAARLAAAGWRVVATDISLEMLRRTKAQAAGTGSALLAGLVRCDVQNLPFRRESTPVILCHGVLEYVPDVPRALKAMREALTPGGLLVTTMPNRLAPSSWASSVLARATDFRSRLLGRRLRRVPGRHRFPWQLDAMAAEAGLRRHQGIVQTFALLPPYLFPRPWLRLNNRIVSTLPRRMFFRWWGTQYIARYDKET